MNLPIVKALKEGTKTVTKLAEKHMPTILIGAGIGGFFASVGYTALKAAPEAVKLIEEAEEETGKELTIKEKVLTTYKCFIPVGLMMSASTAAVLVGHKITLKRLASVTAAYSTVEKLYEDYKAKTKEVVGERKETQIRDEVAKGQIRDIPFDEDSSCPAIETGKGKQLCFDGYSGRYFWSDVEKIRQSINTFNQFLIGDGWMGLNDYYHMLGLPEAKIYEDLGWNARRSLVEVQYTSDLVGDNQPVLVMNFKNEPVLDYQMYY